MNTSKPRKGRKTEPTTSAAPPPAKRRSAHNAPQTSSSSTPVVVEHEPPSHGRETKDNLCKMVLGKLQYGAAQQLPGKFVAVDCEMVGVGPDGKESSLARVSVVNFHGAILLDEFVRQRERVVDYRTEYSGIRPGDLILRAKPFSVVQRQVAELFEGRVVVGHALSNDFTALLLSHPRNSTRDTQYYSWRYKLVKSNRISLRNLVEQELGLTIQSGEHSSVTDSRAAMAVYRLHRKDWESGTMPRYPETSKKRKRSSGDTEQGGGRKGTSSGLSVVVKHSKTSKTNRPVIEDKWWLALADLPFA